MRRTEYLYGVDAPHYCCSLSVDPYSHEVIRAAPIINWTVGKKWEYVKIYFNSKKYKVTFIAELESNNVH